MINIRDFDPSQTKIHRKSYKDIGIYNIGYITKKDEYKINGVNPLYLMISEVEGYIEENKGNKYLTFASSHNNKIVRKICKALG